MLFKILKKTALEVKMNRVNVLISYSIPVAMFDKINMKWYRTSQKWSATTTKHINEWRKNYTLVPVKWEYLDQSYFDNIFQEVEDD